MIDDVRLFTLAEGYIKRAEQVRAEMPESHAHEMFLMQTGSMLMLAFEARRIANRLHDFLVMAQEEADREKVG